MSYVTMHKICGNVGFTDPYPPVTESAILSLYGRIRVSENPYSGIFITVLVI